MSPNARMQVPLLALLDRQGWGVAVGVKRVFATAFAGVTLEANWDDDTSGGTWGLPWALGQQCSMRIGWFTLEPAGPNAPPAGPATIGLGTGMGVRYPVM